MFEAMRGIWEVLLVMLVTVFSKAIGGTKHGGRSGPTRAMGNGYCWSWRLAVETNNMRPWATVPGECLSYVEDYMLGGQYERDMEMVVEEIIAYMKGMVPTADSKDAWILDVDDTCISNLPYYEGKRYGGDPYNREQFSNWAARGSCPAIPAVLSLYRKLIEAQFKVFIITGRDGEFLGAATRENLHDQGFVGYERLILRGSSYRGKSAYVYKSEIRKEIVGEGYRIRGNIGDQWSDLLGDFLADRNFKLPNPMYFVP